MIRAHYEPVTFELLGFYQQAIHKHIPEPTIEIDEQQWTNAVLEAHDRVSLSQNTTHRQAPTAEEQEQQAHQQWKLARQQAVDAIKVEVDGLIFDGNELSQSRMTRAATLAESPEETVSWILADNSVATVTADQLKRAAREAGRVQETLWIRQEA